MQTLAPSPQVFGDLVAVACLGAIQHKNAPIIKCLRILTVAVVIDPVRIAHYYGLWFPFRLSGPARLCIPYSTLVPWASDIRRYADMQRRLPTALLTSSFEARLCYYNRYCNRYCNFSCTS